MYETTAKHLKKCFPHLKIGGPALAGEDWGNEFLTKMQKRNVPIDFFSWHIYCTEPHVMIEKAHRIKKMLIENGYKNAESILNEWNYVKGWVEEFVYSIEVITGMKGAAFNMACMSECQKNPIDMLMYYDARPCVFNGLFDYYTMRPLKGYYPFLWFSKFYGMEEVRCEDNPTNIYTLCGVDSEGKTLTCITYYSDDDCAENKNITIEFPQKSKYEIYLLDDEHDGQIIKTTDDLTLYMTVNSCVLIREI